MSLKKQTFVALIWSFSARFFRIGVQFIVTAILARLLSPDDFGLMGMATVFIGFALIISEMGLGSALIQKQDIEDIHYCSIFWMNIGIGIVMALLFIVLSPLIAWFFKKNELQLIVIACTLNFIFLSLSVVPRSIFQKVMNFKLLSLSESISVFISGITGILFALTGFGVWSLVFQSLCYSLIFSICLHFFSEWRPKFVFSKKAIKDIFQFGSNMTLFTILNYFHRNIDYILIGKFLGTEALGFYTLAYKLMLVPLQHISSVISKVVFPAFSQIQQDVEKVKVNFLKMVKAISLITFPLMALLFSVADEFVLLVYGEKWQPVVLLIKILCFCGMFQSINTTSGIIRTSQGKSGLHLKIGILNTILVTIVISVSLYWGIYIVALSYTVLYFFWYHFDFYVAGKLITLQLSQYIKKLLPSYGLTIALLSVLFILKHFLQDFVLEIRLFIILSAGSLFYLLLLILTKQVTLSRNKKIEINL